MVWKNNSHPTSYVQIEQNKIYVKLAKSSTELAKGLGGVQKLKEDEGMLFVLGEKQNYTFWMKDMFIPIDMIWINDNIIVDISPNVAVENKVNLTQYSPKTPANYVLEVNAGYTKTHNIKIGNKVIKYLRQ